MADSILTSVKKVLGIEEEYTAFDLDVTMHINSAFGTLHQLGVGPTEPFFLDEAEPKSTEWTEFIENNRAIQSVKTYVYLSVKMLFDPPETSFVLTAMENQKKELEWRLNVVMEGVRHGNG